MIANIFFVLRDMKILSKRKMFKINQTFDLENFQVRAGTCARYILHRIYRILKKSRFFHVFWGVYGYEYIRCFRRYRHGFKTKNAQNQSNLRPGKFSGARGHMRALYFTWYLQHFEKMTVLSYFLGSLWL